MIGDLAAAIEATALSQALRNSVWVYPFVNAGHILGVALLVGSVLPLDLRLLGIWSTTPLEPLWRVLTRTASVGLGLTVVFGILLFITRASTYVQSSLFIAKMGVLLIGLVNILILRKIAPDDRVIERRTNEKLPVRVRIAAGISLVAWLVSLVLGRLIGYR